MIDKLTDYPELAAKTEKELFTLPPLALRLLHGTIGLQTEVGEVAESVQAYILSNDGTIDKVNLAEEVGDILWYLAIIANALQLSFFLKARQSSVQVPLGLLNGELTIVGGKIADVVKRFAIYEKDIDLTLMQNLLDECLNILDALTVHADVTLIDCAIANIGKLQKRYPEKYSNEAALARADKAVVLVEGELKPENCTIGSDVVDKIAEKLIEDVNASRT